MLETREIPETNIIEIEWDGALEEEDFDRAAEALERAIERRGEVRLLEIVRRFGPVDPGAIWKDLKFTRRHWRDFPKAAVVSDKRSIEAWTSIVKHFIPSEVRHFHLDEIDEARAWLREDEASQS